MTPARRRSWSIIEAPTDLGLAPTGVSELSAALRDAGLFEQVARVHDAVRLDVPAYSRVRDPATGVLNADGIRRFSSELARAIRFELDRSRVPIVLGGDCSVLLGAGLALQRLGKYGLLFLDGHSDFYSPASEPNGELASMDLAAVTGRLPALTEALWRGAMFDDAAVVVLGYRDMDDAAAHGSPDVRETQIRALDLSDVRERGPAEAARVALTSFERADLRGFWLHLDADVLADDVMPAVDYRMPGGLTLDELGAVLDVAFGLERLVGFDLTIYNPRLDDSRRSAGVALARMLNVRLRNAS